MGTSDVLFRPYAPSGAKRDDDDDDDGDDDVLKAFKIAQAIGEYNLKNFQNITSDHKSRNTRAAHAIAIFCLFYSQQNHTLTLLYTRWVHIT